MLKFNSMTLRIFQLDQEFSTSGFKIRKVSGRDRFKDVKMH